MTIAELMQKMIAFSQGNRHDISHLLKVWGFARTIGELERLPAEQQYILEAAAVVHDIACPACRVKYGNTDGKHQEAESAAVLAEFFFGTDLTETQRERITWLVSHHHTYTNVDGMDHRILLEADYLVNADESCYPQESIRTFEEKVFRTETGKRLLRELYSL